KSGFVASRRPSRRSCRRNSTAGNGPVPRHSTRSNAWRKRWSAMKKGEVWRVRIPPAPGHGQTGERPAIIVQEDAFIASLPTVLIVPFTSAKGANRFDGTLEIHPDNQNG